RKRPALLFFRRKQYPAECRCRINGCTSCCYGIIKNLRTELACFTQCFKFSLFFYTPQDVQYFHGADPGHRTVSKSRENMIFKSCTLVCLVTCCPSTCHMSKQLLCNGAKCAGHTFPDGKFSRL